jgi:hypothetical protein
VQFVVDVESAPHHLPDPGKEKEDQANLAQRRGTSASSIDGYAP